MTSHADRSGTGELALCRRASGFCFRRKFRSQSVVVQTPRDRRPPGGCSVQRDIRILELLPARLTASDVDNGAEVASYHGCADYPGRSAKAE